MLAAPLPVAPLLVVTVLAAPLPAGPSLPVPVLVDPMAGPSDGESVGLVLAPPVTGELDAGVTGVEEPLPGVDEDAGAWGLAALDGLAVPGVQEGVRGFLLCRAQKISVDSVAVQKCCDGNNNYQDENNEASQNPGKDSFPSRLLRLFLYSPHLSRPVIGKRCLR